jgi:hypothetical protein
VLFPERTFGPQALPVDPGPVSLASRSMPVSILPPHALTECPRSGLSGHALNAPTRTSEPFWLVLALRNLPEFWANKPITRCLDRRAKCQSGTLLGATGGTQTHSRRTGSKLGQLLCTRQGLVRVPESNTKYGGKPGKTGGTLHPLCRQVSVSPQGFPSEKNCLEAPDFGFVPLFTGQLFIALEGLP